MCEAVLFVCSAAWGRAKWTCNRLHIYCFPLCVCLDHARQQNLPELCKLRMGPSLGTCPSALPQTPARVLRQGRPQALLWGLCVLGILECTLAGGAGCLDSGKGVSEWVCSGRVISVNCVIWINIVWIIKELDRSSCKVLHSGLILTHFLNDGIYVSAFHVDSM